MGESAVKTTVKMSVLSMTIVLTIISSVKNIDVFKQETKMSKMTRNLMGRQKMLLKTQKQVYFIQLEFREILQTKKVVQKVLVVSLCLFLTT